MFYIQCTMFTNNVSYTAFIPEQYAIKRKKIEIKLMDNYWKEWVVFDVYKHTKTDNPPDYRKNIRGHRQATGDSLPKKSRN